jgi:uncharacterized phage protein (TIGR02220 family)
MARYRKTEVAMWGDRRFRELSSPPPNGKSLWQYLLTGPRTTQLPGLLVASAAVMADDLKWPLEGFMKAFAEVSAKGMAKADWDAGVVVLSKALIDSSGQPRDTSRPESPNVLKGWAKAWNEVPDCLLKTEYLHSVSDFAKALGKAFTEAFAEGWAKAIAQASVHPSPNQEQEQEREQEQEQEEKKPAPDGAITSSSVSRERKVGRVRQKPSDPTPAELASVRVVLDKLQAQNDVAYEGSKAHTKLIVARLREGVSELDLRHIIGYCAIERRWKGDPKWEQYLRPETLFGPENISKYLEPARSWVKKNRLDEPEEPVADPPRIDESEVEPLWMAGHP